MGRHAGHATAIVVTPAGWRGRCGDRGSRDVIASMAAETSRPSRLLTR